MRKFALNVKILHLWKLRIHTRIDKIESAVAIVVEDGN